MSIPSVELMLELMFIGREPEIRRSSMSHLRQHRKTVASKACERQHSSNLKNYPSDGKNLKGSWKKGHSRLKETIPN